MKLVRYGQPGHEKPGLLDGNTIRDLSGVVPDLDRTTLTPDGLKRIADAARAGNLPAVTGQPRLGSCVAQPGNFIAIGLNFADHAAESNQPVPKEPIIFNKAPNCISGPTDDIIIPKDSTKLDWECELGFVISRRASYVSEGEALDYVAGYCLANDVSERNFQLERGGNWTKGKSAPSFGPLGPWLVTPDEIGDVGSLDMWLDVNGQRMQTGNTNTMIFDVKTIISYTSRFMTLEPGDVIVTGTPPGVGAGKKPPVFLKAGDVVKLGIAGLGEQTCRVVPFFG